MVELDPSIYEADDREAAAAEAAEFQDWDAFWASQSSAIVPTKIRGVMVKPPIDLPLSALRKLEAVQASSNEQDHKDMLAEVFGVDVFDRWEAAGMGIREMQVVLAWAGAHMRGEPCTFEQAVELYREAMAAREREAGKARATRPKRTHRSVGKSSRRR